MKFDFTVKVVLERTQGKFAPRDELMEKIREVIQDADPGTIDGDNEGQYEVASWEVDEA